MNIALNRKRAHASLIALLLCLPLMATCSLAPAQLDPTQIQPSPSQATPVLTEPATQADTPTATPPSSTVTPATPVPPHDPNTPFEALRMPYLEFGVVTHLYYTDRARVISLAKIAGFEWVRQQIHWKDIESSPGVYYWNELDNIVEAAKTGQTRLLLNMVQAPDFYNPTNGMPSDPRTLGNFVEAMVRRYGAKIGAIEIWNEPNLAVENGGRVTDADPAHYAELLIECYKRIKAVQPNIVVLAAAPSSTGVRNENIAIPDQDYLRALYAYQNGIIKYYFDAQALHPGAAANPPNTLYPEQPSFIANCKPAPDRCWNDHPTHYFRHIEAIRALMLEMGLADRQIWITEYGWATANDTPNFEFGNLTSFDQQAEYISQAIQYVAANYHDEQGHSWVGAMFLWNMNFAVLWGMQGDPLNEQASFSLLNPDWSPRPAFITLQGLHQQLKQQR